MSILAHLQGSAAGCPSCALRPDLVRTHYAAGASEASAPASAAPASAAGPSLRRRIRSITWTGSACAASICTRIRSASGARSEGRAGARYRRDIVCAEEGEAGDAKEGVEDVRLVARLVGYACAARGCVGCRAQRRRGGLASILLVLAREDELAQASAVDPLVASEHHQRGENPPRVADIGLLLRATVEATAGGLPLAQPPAQLVGLAPAELARDRQRADAREDLACVRLAAGLTAVAAVEVGAGGDMRDRRLHLRAAAARHSRAAGARGRGAR